MFLRCLHSEAGRTEFDLQEGSSHRCLLYILKPVRVLIRLKVPEVQQSHIRLRGCWTHTPALIEAVFRSFFFSLFLSLLLLVSGLLESFCTHNFHTKRLCCGSMASEAPRLWSAPNVPTRSASLLQVCFQRLRLYDIKPETHTSGESDVTATATPQRVTQFVKATFTGRVMSWWSVWNI